MAQRFKKSCDNVDVNRFSVRIILARKFVYPNSVLPIFKGYLRAVTALAMVTGSVSAVELNQ